MARVVIGWLCLLISYIFHTETMLKHFFKYFTRPEVRETLLLDVNNMVRTVASASSEMLFF